MDDQVASYLGQGFTQVDTARICGCTESYVSQLIREESFKDKLKVEYAKYQGLRVDQKLVRLKEKTINRIIEQLEYAEIPDAVRILEAVSRIENAKVASTIPTGGTVQHITVNMGQMVQTEKVTFNERREIIAIGERSLAPMATEGVRKMFEGLSGGLSGGLSKVSNGLAGELSNAVALINSGEQNEPETVAAFAGASKESSLALQAA